MGEIHECRVGFLHEPSPRDSLFKSMDDAMSAAWEMSRKHERDVVAIWFEEEVLYVFTGGLMFKVVGN